MIFKTRNHFGIMIRRHRLIRDLDEVLLAFGILKRLGSGKLGTFEERIETQKKHYLAQLFRITPFYCYNLHIRGPYSPDLANDLFEIERRGYFDKVKPMPFIAVNLEERFNRLEGFLDGKNIRELELLATFHWLIHEAGCSKESAVKPLIELKEPTDAELRATLKNYKVLIDEYEKN